MTDVRLSSPFDATRRRFLSVSAAAGLGGTLLPGALLALAAKDVVAESAAVDDAAKLPAITVEMIEQAAVIAGVSFSAEQRKVMIDGLASQRDDVLEVRKLPLPNAVVPSLVFDPVPPGAVLETVKFAAKYSAMPHVVFEKNADDPAALEAFCFFTVRDWAELLRTKRVSSVALTKMYLARLKRLDAQLHCVITLTEERALKQAAAADAEIRAGKYRGPLHGVPWGAKDLLAVAGYPTTWGAGWDGAADV